MPPAAISLTAFVGSGDDSGIHQFYEPDIGDTHRGGKGRRVNRGGVVDSHFSTGL